MYCLNGDLQNDATLFSQTDSNKLRFYIKSEMILIVVMSNMILPQTQGRVETINPQTQIFLTSNFMKTWLDKIFYDFARGP